MNTFKRAIWSAVFVVAGAMSTATQANATVKIYLYESGADVIGSFSGSVDLTGMSFGGALTEIPILVPSDGAFASYADFDSYTGPIFAPSFGSLTFSFPTSREGDAFGITFFNLGVPSGYTSGSYISGLMTFAGQTLVSLGANAGVYTYTLPADTITLNVGIAPPPVPLPASLPLLVGGLAGMTLLRRRSAD